MKINPVNFWYPNWNVNPGHNSIYYNRVSVDAIHGIECSDPTRVNGGVIRNWVEPMAGPAVVLHIKHKVV